jgi:adenosylhomocysteine nucleosidase
MEIREMDEHPPVILVSANSEWQALKGILKPAKTFTTPFGETFEQGKLIFFHGGWGKISAAASAQFTIDRYQPGLLVNIGTCGGFAGRVARGTVILVDKTIVYDIFEQMSDPREAIEAYSTELDLTWLKELPPHPVQRGLLVSADRDIVKDDILMLVEKYGAVAADWESGAIAWVAKRNGVKCLILRGVSDLVSSDGGEAYGNIDLFHENTKGIMRTLIEQLPDWLEQA